MGRQHQTNKAILDLAKGMISLIDLTEQGINAMQYHLILERYGRSQRLYIKLWLKALDSVKIQQQQISKSRVNSPSSNLLAFSRKSGK